jgi:hypothetical protein
VKSAAVHTFRGNLTVVIEMRAVLSLCNNHLSNAAGCPCRHGSWSVYLPSTDWHEQENKGETSLPISLSLTRRCTALRIHSSVFGSRGY